MGNGFRVEADASVGLRDRLIMRLTEYGEAIGWLHETTAHQG